MRSRLMGAWALAASLAMTGCGSMTTSGNRNIGNDELVQQIVKGQSTKDDVRGLLGEPQNVMFSSSEREVWVYTSSTTAGAHLGSILARVPVVGALTGGVAPAVSTATTVQVTAEFDRASGLLTDFVRTINDSTGVH